MNSQPWDNAKLAEWKKFWESEMGKEALSKINDLREMALNLALQQSSSDAITYYVGRAAGIDLVLTDIRTGIEAAEKAAKEEQEKAKKTAD